MPYRNISELPDAIKALPDHAREIWMAAFNAAYEEYKDDGKAAATAWAAVKNKYRKNDKGEWVAIEKGKLVALAALKELPDPPSEFLLIPDGVVEIEGEPPAFLDEASANEIIDNFSRRGNDMVIDYEHQTLENVQAPAAGWIERLEYRARQGLYAIAKWTERAKEYLRNKEYRYFSPVFWVRNDDRKIFKIENVALTNWPKINNLKPIMAKFGGLEIQPEKKEKEEEGMIEKLRSLLGLGKETPEDKIFESVLLLVNKVKDLEAKTVIACKEVLDALGAKADVGKDEVLKIISGMKAPSDAAVALGQEVAKLKTKIAEMEREDLVQLALKEGKTSPEELDKWGRKLAQDSPEQFRLIVLARPAGSVIPIGGMKAAPKEKIGALDDTQREINKMMGISDETWAKYNKVN